MRYSKKRIKETKRHRKQTERKVNSKQGGNERGKEDEPRELEDDVKKRERREEVKGVLWVRKDMIWE